MERDEVTIDFYDNSELANFFKVVMGDDGGNIHYGIFKTPEDSFVQAALNTVDTMLALANTVGAIIDQSSRVLDAGAGNGGPAHHLVKRLGCHVTCLNLCAGQNAVNEELANKLGILERIDIHIGSFEACPDGWSQTFDIVWSEDAIVHSNKKLQVFSELFRVLKPGGYLIMTDSLAHPSASDESRAIFKKRLHVDELCTPEDYKMMMKNAGLEVLQDHDLTCHLLKNYEVLMERLITEKDRLTACSEEFFDKYASSLQKNIDALNEGPANCWWLFAAKKPKDNLPIGIPNGVGRGVPN